MKPIKELSLSLIFLFFALQAEGQNRWIIGTLVDHDSIGIPNLEVFYTYKNRKGVYKEGKKIKTDVNGKFQLKYLSDYMSESSMCGRLSEKGSFEARVFYKNPVTDSNEFLLSVCLNQYTTEISWNLEVEFFPRNSVQNIKKSYNVLDEELSEIETKLKKIKITNLGDTIQINDLQGGLIKIERELDKKDNDQIIDSLYYLANNLKGKGFDSYLKSKEIFYFKELSKLKKRKESLLDRVNQLDIIKNGIKVFAAKNEAELAKQKEETAKNEAELAKQKEDTAKNEALLAEAKRKEETAKIIIGVVIFSSILIVVLIFIITRLYFEKTKRRKISQKHEALIKSEAAKDKLLEEKNSLLLDKEILLEETQAQEENLQIQLNQIQAQQWELLHKHEALIKSEAEKDRLLKEEEKLLEETRAQKENIEKQSILIQEQKATIEKQMFDVEHRLKGVFKNLSGLFDRYLDKLNTESNEYELIEEISYRVESLGEIYKVLNSDSKETDPTFLELAEEILEKLGSIYEVPGADIQLTWDIDGYIRFDRRTNHRLSLIIYELVSNAYFHAFKNLDNHLIHSGIIEVNLKLENDLTGKYCLEVKDNGPKGFHQRTGIAGPLDELLVNEYDSGLRFGGFRSINDFTSDIGGEFVINSPDIGSYFSLTFNKIDDKMFRHLAQ